MNSTFWTVAAFGFIAVMIPGPDFFAVTSNSILHSKKVGLATALGIALGNVGWVLASLLGISLLISRTVVLFNILKWVGALYLIYVGCKMLRSKKKGDDPADTRREELSTGKAFKLGFLTNILNVKCAFFFLSFFGVIITPETPLGPKVLYGLEMIAIALTWFSLVALFFSTNAVRGIFRRFGHWADRLGGLVFIWLASRIALYEHK